MSAVKALMSARPVAYYPDLARAVGGIAPALFFQQIAHWQGKNPEGWVYRTQEELEEELAMSPKVQASARDHLVKRKLLEEKRGGMPRRLYYRPVWENLEAALQTLPMASTDSPYGQVQSSPSGDTTLKNSNKSSSRRDAGASRSIMDNPFGYYCEVAEALKVEIVPEDRIETAKHFKDLVRMHEPTEEELKRVVSKMLEARTAGVFWSPQKALEKVRSSGAGSSNVTQLRPVEPARPQKRVIS